jgi:hypothetical protein
MHLFSETKFLGTLAVFHCAFSVSVSRGWDLGRLVPRPFTSQLYDHKPLADGHVAGDPVEQKGPTREADWPTSGKTAVDPQVSHGGGLAMDVSES